MCSPNSDNAGEQNKGVPQNLKVRAIFGTMFSDAFRNFGIPLAFTRKRRKAPGFIHGDIRWILAAYSYARLALYSGIKYLAISCAYCKPV